MAKKYPHLFSEGNIGRLRLKNRTIMPPMGTCLASPDQSMNDYYLDYHFARADGGVALQILGVVSVDPLGPPLPCVPGIYHDRFIPGLSRLVQGIHERGGKCAVQLHHAGRAAYPHVISAQSVAPSPLPSLAVGAMPRELSIAEIHALVAAFGDGARRAQRAGCDAVEVHGAHGYLVAQFLSPLANRRADAYGGSQEGRARFALEIVEDIRAKTGPDYPILFRLSGDEFLEGGLTLDDTRRLAVRLEEAGADAMHVSAGNFYEMGSPEKIITPMYLERGALISLAAQIKQVVKVPVIAVGSITAELAERTLAEGQADFISFGRALIADPHLPRKVEEGREDEVSHCIRCNGCLATIFQFKPLACTVNPRVGREEDSRLSRAEKPKRVMVVGGGPAGLEAAVVAGTRGHAVTLYEQGEALGGEQLHLAMSLPGKGILKTMVTYRSTLLDKLANVEVRLGTRVDRSLVEQERPDMVVVATGGRPRIPKDLGMRPDDAVTAHDVLAGRARVGNSVIMVGGGLVGCETAHYLAHQGKAVTIIEMLDEVAVDMDIISRLVLLRSMQEKGVELVTRMRVVDIKPGRVLARNPEGEEQSWAADSVVLALGVEPANELLHQLEGLVPELYACGDARAYGTIMDAVHDGFHLTKRR